MNPPASQKAVAGSPSDIRKRVREHDTSTTPNVSDPFCDLLIELDERLRRGLERRLAVGYYEGWQPTRAEIASMIAVENGQIT